MHLWHDVSPGENLPDEINVIIENPTGTNNKYEIDKDSGVLIKLDRVLYGANFYPFDYGFMPQSYWEDNDPLDVMVLTTNPLVPLCLVVVRPIGVMHMTDSGESDDKLITVPVKDPRFDHIKTYKDLGKHKIKKFTHFWETMKTLQNKKVEITGVEGVKEAKEAIKKSLELYKEKFSK